MDPDGMILLFGILEYQNGAIFVNQSNSVEAAILTSKIFKKFSLKIFLSTFDL